MSVQRVSVAAAFVVACAANVQAQSLQFSASNLLAMDDVEITPDQRYAVARQNFDSQYARIYELQTGGFTQVSALMGVPCGPVLDAVAVTNSRAVVLGGSHAVVLDLANLANPVIAQRPVGVSPNDVAITPDGTIAVVRGGRTSGPNVGGIHVIELATGTQIGFSAGLCPRYDFDGTVPYTFNTDGVAVTDRYAVALSLVSDTPPAQTRVTIWDLHPAPSAPPIVILDTASAPLTHLVGAPHDVAITPDGNHAVVRSEEHLAVWNLSNGNATPIFAGPLTNDPGPFQYTAMDSVEVTNSRVVTLANVVGAPPATQTQVEVVHFTGARWSGRIAGRPHDLAITPDGTRAVVRTSAGLALYRIVNIGPNPVLTPIDWLDAPSATDNYLSGFDSVTATNDFAVSLTNTANLADTRVWFWSIVRGELELLSSTLLANTRPTDLAITPDGRRIAVTGNASVNVFHLGSGGNAFEHRPVGTTAYYQWCDGVAVSSDRAVGVGQHGPQNGWITGVDTSPISTRYCTANVNSSGRPASILAMGRASVTANSLKLCVDGASRNARGRFVQGNAQAQIPFGDGVQCVGGLVFGLRFLNANSVGSGFAPVNLNGQQNPAGVVLPGSTWHYQFVFQDEGAPGFGVNSSDAVSITFTP